MQQKKLDNKREGCRIRTCKTKIDNMGEYDTILLGYPNWWATVPMPIVTFLESYDFSGKTTLPFCSHGGGEFGQSIIDIS